MPNRKFQSHKFKVFIILIRGGLGNQMFGYAFFLDFTCFWLNGLNS